jgi:RNA polymerase sigma-70 factor (ECF subfamily)
VHAYLSRRAGREVADELLGEVWLRAFRSRDSYDSRTSSARPWLYGITRNTLRAEWRLKRLDGPAGSEESEDPWPAIDDRLDANAQAGALREALESLDPADREVLLLVAWEHLDPSEVAISLDMPQGTVRWRLHRARKQLQERFAADAATRPLRTRPKEA